MNVIILNTNSFGGNYEYSRCLAKAYAANEFVDNCKVILPLNALQEENDCFKKVLISDQPSFQNKILKRFYFLFRSFVNPIKTFLFLKKSPASLVIVNDYEQITSFFWAPLFRMLKKKHTFFVLLHDPDRDNYLPIKSLSNYTMKRVMSVMDAALYHELLPDKPYYLNIIPKFSIPHGLYSYPDFDIELHTLLMQQKGVHKLMGVIGNIRDEKNYSLLIDSLPELPDVMLLIAGSPSNSAVSIDSYKKQIQDLNVQNQVIWIEKRLSDEEMQAIIQVCDLILLYYKHSFTSQSGLLNLIAPHKKKLIVSDGESGLTKVVQHYALGEVVVLNRNAFVDSVNKIIFTESTKKQLDAWDAYLNYASWDNHVRIVIQQMQYLQALKKQY